MRIATKTLGCKVNQVETEALAAALPLVAVDFPQAADVYLINSCAVTGTAGAECRAVVRRARRANPEAVIAVTGCYVELAREELREAGAHILVDNTHKAQLPILVAEHLGLELSDYEAAETVWGNGEAPGERIRAFLKVQDGCAAGCSYCIIWKLRGEERNRPIAAVVRAAEKLAAQGIKEIVLTGVHLGAFEPGLVVLLRELLPIGPALRISSLEPECISPELLELMAQQPRIRPHLHLPLQSGSDHILGKMRRRYQYRHFRARVRQAYELVPGFSLSMDLIAGFPGETEEDHQATVRAVEESRPVKLHVFPFSPREGTDAALMPHQVPPPLRQQRTAELIALGERIVQEHIADLVGNTTPFLVERVSDSTARGYTPGYLKVRGRGIAQPGQDRGLLVQGAEGNVITGAVLP
ncbi:MAG: MiaB/RimO family radical SAM methylthiotransferase [Deinococcus sp.]|nr:MiaB/RimO family radical SAM methylthiotransferase [Deinococcus sp.]